MGNVMDMPLRNCIEIGCGTVTASSDPERIGQFMYFVTYYDDEGCSLGVWDGVSYPEAREAALEWAADGFRIVDLVHTSRSAH